MLRHRGHLGFDEYDIANQGFISHHFSLADRRWERFSAPFRYVWPAIGRGINDSIDAFVARATDLAAPVPYMRGWA